MYVCVRVCVLCSCVYVLCLEYAHACVVWTYVCRRVACVWASVYWFSHCTECCSGWTRNNNSPISLACDIKPKPTLIPVLAVKYNGPTVGATLSASRIRVNACQRAVLLTRKWFQSESFRSKGQIRIFGRTKLCQTIYESGFSNCYGCRNGEIFQYFISVRAINWLLLVRRNNHRHQDSLSH